MKKALCSILTLVLALGAMSIAANAQAIGSPRFPANANGKVMVGEFGKWAFQSLNAVTAASQSVTLNGCYIKVGTAYVQFYPFVPNLSVYINDGSLSEAVTITSVTQPTPTPGPSTVNPYNCTFTATFANAHSSGFSVTSNDGGLLEAMTFASMRSIGAVIVDSTSAITSAQIAAVTPIANITVEQLNVAPEQSWNVQPSTLTALATPATRSATAGNTQVISGTATGTWTAAATYVCVTYVDMLGGESPCSATYNLTATASVALNFAAPAASTGAVGWRAYAGLSSLSTAYQLPISSSTCTLSTQTPYPTCAIGAAGVFPTPSTTTALAPAAGGIAATYRPNTQSHTTFAYVPATGPTYGLQSNYGPFVISPALTAGQSVVLGTVPLPTGYLNYIGKTIRISGKLTVTPSTQGSIQLLVGIGDVTDFSTGTPKAVCTITTTGTITTAAYDGQFSCTWTVNAVGTTGSISPDGFSIFQLQAGTTTSPSVAVESATGAITVDTVDPATINVEFLQTSAAESTTPPQLQTLHIETLN